MGITVWPVDAVAGAPNYTGRMARQTAGALVGGKTAARPLGGTSGLIVGVGSAVVSATTTTWTVGQCVGVIDGETATAAGPYFFSNDANVTGSMIAADGTNARIDIISFQLSDPAEGDGTSTPGGAFVYTAGTPAGSPVAPSTPARSVTIAQINVPHSDAGSPSITDVAPRVVAAGGIRPVTNSAAYPASPYVGQSVYDLALKKHLFWNGTVWGPSGGDTGWIAATSLASGWSMDSTPLQFRQQGNVIRMKGGIVNGSFNSLTLTAACAVPSGIALPTDTVVIDLPSNSGALNTTRLARILTDGTVQVSTNGTTVTAYRFDSKFYLAD